MISCRVGCRGLTSLARAGVITTRLSGCLIKCVSNRKSKICGLTVGQSLHEDGFKDVPFHLFKKRVNLWP